LGGGPFAGSKWKRHYKLKDLKIKTTLWDRGAGKKVAKILVARITSCVCRERRFKRETPGPWAEGSPKKALMIGGGVRRKGIWAKGSETLQFNCAAS